MTYRKTGLTPLFAALLLLFQQPPATAQQWIEGRATYYGAPQSFARVFDPIRGQGSFGILEYGSCSFTNSDGTLPFPRDSVAAAADANPDFAGSCGRCYAVRCKTGLVLNNDGKPLKINDTSTIYLPSVAGAKNLTDTQGRLWPGNTAEAKGELLTRCYDPSKEVLVRIIDTCPCTQVLPSGAPGVKAGGEIRQQKVCCQGSAGIDHFDLSYWAFEKLAHPLYGQMMLEYRPVDCKTSAPVPYNPGYISKTDIYQGGTAAGWNWFPYFSAYNTYEVPGAAPDGSSATCVQLSKDGGLSFHVRQGFLPGYQPFAGARAVQVWLKSDAQAVDATATSTPPGKPVDVKVFIQNTEFQKYCNSDVRTGNYTSNASAPGGWNQFSIPFEDFKCNVQGAFPADVDRIDFQNTNIKPALFCLAGLRIIR